MFNSSYNMNTSEQKVYYVGEITFKTKSPSNTENLSTKIKKKVKENNFMTE